MGTAGPTRASCPSRWSSSEVQPSRNPQRHFLGDSAWGRLAPAAARLTRLAHGVPLLLAVAPARHLAEDS
jgi:hypothetical protein